MKKKTAVINTSVIDKLQQNIGDLTPVITVFLQTLEDRLQELEIAVSKQEPETIIRSAHTLKGSSSQFGAEEIAALCRQMENMGREKSIARADSLLVEIRGAAARLRKVLSKELD